MVSIILPNFNYARYLPVRIDSILSQSYEDFELIILDDASSDNSREVIETYKLNDSRIRVIYNDINSGSPFIQWEKGIQEATGDLIWIAEADDYCKNDMLKKLVEAINKAGDTVIAFCDSFIVDEKGQKSGIWSKKSPDKFKLESGLYDGIDLIKNHFIHRNIIPNASGAIFRKSRYQEVGEVDKNIANCADWLLWIKMVHIGKVAYVDEPLNYFRRHSASVINTIRSKAEEKNVFHEFYSMSMRIKLSAWLNEFDALHSLVAVNNEYIAKDLINRSKWASKNKDYFNKWTSVLKAFQKSGYNTSYLPHLFS